MVSATLRNVSDLTSLFQGAATVVAIRIPLLKAATPSSTELETLKSIIEKASKELIHDGSLIIPGSDGFLIVANQVTDGFARKNINELGETIRRNVEASNLPKLVDYERIHVQTMAAGNIMQRNVELNHEYFVSLSPELRMQTLNDLSLNVAEDAIRTVTAHDPQNTDHVERFLEYPLIPRSNQTSFAHRDAYFEPSPVCTSIDLIMLRKAASEVIGSLESGDTSRITTPVNLMSISDSRYWRAYENELRNIPDFVRKLVGVQLVRVSAGTPTSKVEDVLMRLRPAIGHIYVSLDLDWEHSAANLLMGLDGISVCFPPDTRHSQEPAAVIDKMRHLFLKFQRSDVQLIAQNVPSKHIGTVCRLCKPDLITLPACERETAMDDPDEPGTLYV